jgi:hypothetical protein
VEVAVLRDERTNATAFGTEHENERHLAVDLADGLCVVLCVHRDSPETELAQLLERAHQVADLCDRDELACAR